MHQKQAEAEIALIFSSARPYQEASGQNSIKLCIDDHGQRVAKSLSTTKSGDQGTLRPEACKQECSLFMNW